MATDRKIQEETKRLFGFVPKACWIADIRAEFGLTPQIVPNRNGEDRAYPCPLEKRRPVIQAMRTLGVI
jgi:hypothetical protein